MLKKWVGILLIAVLMGTFGPALTGEFPPNAQAQAGDAEPVIINPTHWGTLPSLQSLALEASPARIPSSPSEIPLFTLPHYATGRESADPAAPTQFPSPGIPAPAPQSNFEGLNNRNNVLPPDPNGDIGPDHYVQMVNLSFAIYDRSGNLLLGPFNNNILWKDLGGACEFTNNGDPIVIYDHLADRWLMSQFSIPNFPYGPYYECVAVSATGDPTGAWHRYEYKISDTKINDYPKFALWPDGYYLTFNQFQLLFGWAWAGQGAAVLERDQMLQGKEARLVYFDLYPVDPMLGGMLPADLDGPPPPQGAPNPYVQMDDDGVGYPQDQLQIWNFQVDWVTPANSSFTFGVTLPVDPFDSDLCAYSRNCIPQPGGQPVDAISDRLMYRLQYRNFPAFQSLTVNHTVDVNGADQAGVRWYELRDTGGGWGVHQQGNWAPDGDHRWMGSLAMNSDADMALGYSVSSNTTYPSIRYTGRLPLTALGQMAYDESEIIAGSGYQTSGSGRWGDYSMMAVDPVDDCTFWYTQQYYAIAGNSTWQTRIASFKFHHCMNPPNVTIFDPQEGQEISAIYRVKVWAFDLDGIARVELRIDGDPFIDITSNFHNLHYFYDWHTWFYENDVHTLRARATDENGFVRWSEPVTVIISNDVPISKHYFPLIAR